MKRVSAGKIVFCSAFFFCAGQPAGAAINDVITELAARPGIANAQWGISVKDAATGAEVAAYNPRANLTPASILKIFVTAAAFDLLGPGYKIKTGVYYDGFISNGFLNGNLYLKGAGDPSLGSQLVKDARSLEETFRLWTEAVKAKGINVINGAVAADDSAFESAQPGSWAWEDIGNYYAAAASALTVNDNLYKLYFKPAAQEGAGAKVLRTEPLLPDLKFENHMVTGPAGSGDNGYIFAFPGQNAAVLRGSVPRGPEEFAIKGALPDPALFAAQGFNAYLVRAGINSNKKPVRAAGPAAGLTLVTETEGAPLENIVRITNKRSFNLYAELLLRQLAVFKGLKGTDTNGIKVLKDFLAAQGVATGEMRLEDASGLSQSDMVKAENFTDLLCAVSKKKYFEAYKDTLVFPADAEASGHIRRMGRDTYLATGLRIKSGSLTGVRSYTGYLKTKKGRTLAFTFILNNYSADPADIDSLHEELLAALADNY
ncbi:MAG TPA: D-alanyl-D-alanine carboxypeptidase/D-alanyl-D-alanine-endopeptidase [Elusimicrobiales bacterium]|mgnify:CR=1 FL=1|nr:D-alanyl-D-alanine carboxypeptidase/D-alanyl-D-alanine-endopeptidase [Elusimicrobiales bacterium]